LVCDAPEFRHFAVPGCRAFIFHGFEEAGHAILQLLNESEQLSSLLISNSSETYSAKDVDRVSLLWADRRAKLIMESPLSLSEAPEPFSCTAVPLVRAELHVFFYANPKN